MIAELEIHAPIAVDVMTTSDTLKIDPVPMPSGQSSPRSPVDFDLAVSPKKSPKKKVAFILPASLKKPIIKDKKVSFSTSVAVKEIRHINAFSEEEKEAIWCGERDYQIIKAMVKSTVIMMMKGEQIPEEDVDYCTRGLEFRTKAGSRVRSRNKMRARLAVLNEQDLQQEEGYFDPQFIAMACMDASLECRTGARARALHDEKVIQSYLADVRAVFGPFR